MVTSVVGDHVAMPVLLIDANAVEIPDSWVVFIFVHATIARVPSDAIVTVGERVSSVPWYRRCSVDQVGDVGDGMFATATAVNF